MWPFSRKQASPRLPIEQQDPYIIAYRAWRDRQVCLGCGKKSGERIEGYAPGEKCWMTEYQCEPCWRAGKGDGMPAVMFDGYSGHTYSTKPSSDGGES